MLLLSIDVGGSSVRTCIFDAENQSIITSAQYPDEESPITPLQAGRAGQSPDMWWQQTQQAPALCNKKSDCCSKNISAIGITYQMHGLILVAKEQKNCAAASFPAFGQTLGRRRY